MSGFAYPAAAHNGTGEVSAVLRRADAVPELSAPSGSATHYLATGATTRGAFGLFRWDMGSEPSGPSPHFHRSITFTPGAPREDYFETLADRAGREALTPEDWTEFFLRHDTFWVEEDRT